MIASRRCWPEQVRRQVNARNLLAHELERRGTRMANGSANFLLAHFGAAAPRIAAALAPDVLVNQPEKTADVLASARKVIESLITTPATAAELDRAKNEVINESVPAATKIEAVADPWLDADTYRLNAIQDQAALLRAVSAADIQRVATRLFTNGNS